MSRRRKALSTLAVLVTALAMLAVPASAAAGTIEMSRIAVSSIATLPDPSPSPSSERQYLPPGPQWFPHDYHRTLGACEDKGRQLDRENVYIFRWKCEKLARPAGANGEFKYKEGYSPAASKEFQADDGCDDLMECRVGATVVSVEDSPGF
jgi:hypothetical protein